MLYTLEHVNSDGGNCSDKVRSALYALSAHLSNNVGSYLPLFNKFKVALIYNRGIRAFWILWIFLFII